MSVFYYKQFIINLLICHFGKVLKSTVYSVYIKRDEKGNGPKRVANTKKLIYVVVKLAI